MTARFRSYTNEHPNIAFLAGSCLIGGQMLSIWVMRNWEYLPEWAPVPGLELMNIVSCLRPILLFVCGLPTAIALLAGVLIHLKLLVTPTWTKASASVLVLLLGLAILGASTLPFVFEDQLENRLQMYAISRYDVVIDAIELHRADHGEYPSSLGELVPIYLSAVPGEYMKFGEELNYYPDASTAGRGYVGYGPFIFELTGMYAGIHGQTLKYCPVQDESCSVFSRIDDRWVWAYSFIL